MENKLSEFSKEQLVEILNTSKSFREALIRFGYNTNGSGAYNTVKSHLTKMGIDIPKYNYCGYKIINKINIKDILVENSVYKCRRSLKKRLVSEGFLEYKCGHCGNVGEWNGKKLTLQLEHINGINNDHRLENLIFLCPNCHSQTSTYSGRNRIFTDYPKKKEKVKTNVRAKWKVQNRPPYDELIEMINKSSLTAVGKQFGVSGNAVKKWLKVRYD